LICRKAVSSVLDVRHQRIGVNGGKPTRRRGKIQEVDCPLLGLPEGLKIVHG
jgi:hypothetical protein